MNKSITALISFLLFFTFATFAETIYIDFNGYDAPVSSAYGAAVGVGGVWNKIDSRSAINLTNTSGDITDVNLTLSNDTYVSGRSDSDGSDFKNMVAHNFYAGREWGISLSNLDNGYYDIYVYSPENPNVHTYDFHVNGIYSPSINSDSDDILEEGIDYVLLEDIVISAGTLDILSTEAITWPPWGGVAGLQIVSVPEPSTLALFAAFCGAVVSVRRIFVI